MHLERALLGLCLFAAVAVAPDRAPAASLSFFGNWNCLDSGQPCRGATAPAPDATPGTARRSGLMLRIYESRFQAQAESARRGPPRDRLPIDQPPGFDGSGPAAPPDVFVTPLPAGGVLMLTALGVVLLVRRRRFKAEPA